LRHRDFFKTLDEIMSTSGVTEKVLLDAFHRIPRERWPELLQLLSTFEWPHSSSAVPPIITGLDLLESNMIGVWADREDIRDRQQFARDLRARAEHRADVAASNLGMLDAVPHRSAIE